MNRPKRIQVTDSLGSLRSLPGAELRYAAWPNGAGERLVLIGLGAAPEALTALIPENVQVGYWLADALWRQLPPHVMASIPSAWTRLDADAACLWVRQGAMVWEEPWSLKLFPEATAALKADLLKALRPSPEAQTPGVARAKTMLLAQSSRTLLGRELAYAAHKLGYEVLSATPAHIERNLAELLGEHAVDVFVSINFEGLDALGLNAALCRAYGVKLAVWLVDNPLHLLSGLGSGFWQDCPLFVSDASFVPHLQGLGASRVSALALGAAEHFFTSPQAAAYERFPGVVFVGRSEFPGREAFFSGLRLPEGSLNAALDLMEQGGRPDFAWWMARLDPKPVWPGRAVRLAGLGADTVNRHYRARVLGELARHFPVRVHGDAAFKTLISAPFELAGPVDYYGRLPAVYAGAGVNLALSSLLLPAGLTQRHFDVPAAGGLVVSDKTAGLEVFGAARGLISAFHSVQDLCEVVEQALSGRAGQAELAACVGREHGYTHRLHGLLETL